ncbi:unnamed protein product, partial [Mesorhabditis belari]|uniref:Trifunctional enzyme subunit alpha, mitochondrial n=1 Tax=Mesorhabditis belari TaxID=2138241 RepID=A0AAF3F8D1_9BILA
MLSRLQNTRLIAFASRPLSLSSTRNAGTVKIEKKGDVAVVKIDMPNTKENVLGEALSNDLTEAFSKLENDETVKSVVLMSGKPNSFVAGADITMLSKAKDVADAERMSSEGQKQFARLAESKKPIVAAIMGSCLGGGLELALACHYRIAVNDKKTQLALPEVMLGLLPGAGGTQRLPKLVALPTALDMMLTGKKLKADKAKKAGFVDVVVQPLGDGLGPANEITHKYLEDVAVKTAQQLASGTLKIDRTKPLMQRIQNAITSNRLVLDNVVLKMARDKVMKMTKGNYPAPLRILEVIREGIVNGSAKGYALESKYFGELAKTTQSAALIGLFNGSTDCKKNKYGEGRPINELAVVGAGLMGAGIANVTIDKGVKTVLLDVNESGLERGQNQILTHLATGVKRRKMTLLEKERIVSNLVATTDYQKMKNADIVIEAVFEDIGLKHKVIKQIESIVRPDCVVATNTSALPIAEIAKASAHPENVIGMHYFSPVEKMQLLEIITHEGTSQQTIATAAQLGLKQGKLVVVVKDCPGFFVVRCLAPIMSEITRLLQEGVTPEQLDKITTDFGFPVGAVTLSDEVGLDVAEHVAHFLAGALGARVGGGNPQIYTDLVAAGIKGRKSNKGFYLYGEGKKGSKKVNEEALKIISKYRVTAPAETNNVEDQQIRVLCRFINEAMHCLQEGVIRQPSDGDIASVFGVGFPPFWGGPFRFVDLYGAEKLVAKMDKFSRVYDRRQFEPAQILVDYAKSGRKFY